METTFLVQKNFWFKHFLIVSFLLMMSLVSHASPNLISFQSRLIKPNGQPLEASSVNFRFSLTDALGTCVIFQEDFTNRNMVDSKGLITLTLGGGSKIYPIGPMTLADAFNNYNFPNFNCQAGGSVSAGATDRRRLVMQFNDGSGWQTVPAMDINANPFALQALSAQSLGEYPAADYLRTAALPTCGPTQALNFNGASITCIAAGGAGAGTVTSVTSANTDIAIATTTTTPVLTLNAATTGADKILRLNATGGFDAINAANLTNLNASNLASGTVPAARFPAFTGDVTTVAGNVATTIATNAITSGKILDDEIVDADIKSTAAIARSKIAAESAGNGPGNVLINDGSGNISSLQCADTQVIKFNGAGVAICGIDNAGAGDIANGGNLTGSAVTIGTNDAQSLVLETNNSPAMTILNSGNVGIGTNSPGSRLDIVSTVSPQLKLQYDGSNNFTMGADSFGQVAMIATGTFPVFMFNNALTVAADATSQTSGIDLTRTLNSTTSSSNYGTKVSIDRNAATPAFNDITYGEEITINRTGAASGTSTSAYGSRIVVSNTGASSGSILTYGQRISAVGDTNGTSAAWGSQVTASGADTVYGLHSTVTSAAGGTGYGLYVDAGTGAGNEYAGVFLNGNVGVGTTSPLRLLHVAGPMRITPTTVPAAPAAGDMYVDSADSNKLKIYDGGGWVAAGGGGGGTVTNVSSANTDIGVATGGTTPVLTLNVGTGNDQIVKLNGSAQLPAVSGVNLTALNATNLGSGTVPDARMPALTGDVTTVAGAVSTTIAADAVTSAKILNDEIMNADIKTTAAIDRTKLASGTNDHVLINSGTGVMSSEAQLAVSRGGTGLASYTNNALIMANGTGTALTNATCNVGELLLWSGTAWACTNLSSSAQGYFKDGGNTFTGTATIGTNSNHNLEIETNGATKMTILAGGNVGIGTTNPGGALSIERNDSLANSAGPSINLKNTNPNDPAGAGYNIAWSNYYAGNGAIIGQFGTNYGTGTAAPWNAGSGFYVTTRTNHPIIFATGAAATEKLRITSAGNVGVGTTTPAAKLDVAGDISINGASGGIGAFSNGQLAVTGNPNGGVGVYVNVPNSGISYGGFGIGYDTTVKWRFGIMKTETDTTALTFYEDGETSKPRLSLATGGNVGIGTTVPGAGLDVSNGGNTVLLGADNNALTRTDATIKTARVGMVHRTNAEEQINLISGSAGLLNNNIFIGGGVNTYNAATQIGFYTAANTTTLDGSERMRIDSNGFIGINTTGTPAKQLEVNGDVRIGQQTNRGLATSRGTLSQGSTLLTTTNADVTMDMSKGNMQELASFQCDGVKTITLSNLQDGAAYSIYISGAAAHSGLCLFSAATYSFKSSGGNTAPTASRDVLFSFSVYNNVVIYKMVDNLQ